jgi:hypothetical protein
MADSYLLAEEPIPNHQQQDCRLIVQLNGPEGVDIQTLQMEGLNALKEK